MAKGNMFQGMARGRVGDVVFSRNNGEQISRVRNRHPKNPRTNKQMYQRAVMATVMQAYAAGQELFNHSFQGKSVGAENQRAFLSKNTKLLRGLLASEIEAGTAALNCNVAVVAPGAITPVPNEYMISEGAYPQNFFAWKENEKSFLIPTANAGETVSQYAQRLGLVAGDIYTICGFIVSGSTPSFTVRGVTTATESGYKPESQYPSVFGFVRLQVKDVSAVSASMAEGTMASLFEITASMNTDLNLSGLLPGDTFDVTAIFSASAFPAANYSLGSLGIIRSRLDQDLRSTSFMHVVSAVVDRAANGMYGITSALALAAWQQGTEALGDSDLILEGGDEEDFHRA